MMMNLDSSSNLDFSVVGSDLIPQEGGASSYFLSVPTPGPDPAPMIARGSA